MVNQEQMTTNYRQCKRHPADEGTINSENGLGRHSTYSPNI